MDPRGPIRVAVAAFSGAATLTANWAFPTVPTEIWIAWGAVVQAVAGVVEVLYDARKYKKMAGPA